MNVSNWLYESKKTGKIHEIDSIDMLSVYKGFIYRINNLTTDMSYIGSKVVLSTRKKPIGKRRVEKEGKSAFRRYKVKVGKDKGKWKYYEHVIIETDWLDYTGSCKLLNEHIAQGHVIERNIIHPVVSTKLLPYLEAKYIFSGNALEDDTFYNENIDLKYFKSTISKLLKEEKWP